MEAMATGTKKLTKRMVQEISSSISEELPPGFPKEVLEGISTAAQVTTFANYVVFVKKLQRRRGEFDRFASTAYVRGPLCGRGTDQNNSIHTVCKNINIVASPRMTFYILRK